MFLVLYVWCFSLIVEGSFTNDLGGCEAPLKRVKLSDLERQEFIALVKEGWPFIIEGVADSWSNSSSDSFSGWSCQDFINEFPNAVARAEYTGGKSVSFEEISRAHDGLPYVSVDWEGLKDLGIPFVWHVKDQASEEDKFAFIKKFPGLGHDVLTALEETHLLDSLELWLQPVNGSKASGALAHADGYCSGVFSFQIKGAKRWKFMPPNDLNGYMFNLTNWFDDTDGGIYKCRPKSAEHVGRAPRDQQTGLHGDRHTDDDHEASGAGEGCVSFNPLWKVTVNEGEAIFFPPGIIHETESVSDGETFCTASVTGLLRSPLPMKWIRKFLPGISLVGDGHRCVRQWAKQLGLTKRMLMQNESIVDELAKRFSLEDGSPISIDDVIKYYSVEADTLAKSPLLSLGFTSASIPLTNGIKYELIDQLALDFFGFFDTNEDNSVTKEELKVGVERLVDNEFRSRLVTKVVEEHRFDEDARRLKLADVIDAVEKFKVGGRSVKASPRAESEAVSQSQQLEG